MVTMVTIQLDQYISCDLKFSRFTEKFGFYISFFFLSQNYVGYYSMISVYTT